MPEVLNPRVLDRLEDDVGAALVPKLISSVRVDIATTTEVLQKLMLSSDLASAREHAHRLKASAQVVGMEVLSLCAEQLEFAARDGELERASELAAKLPELSKAAIASANEFLKVKGFSLAESD